MSEHRKTQKASLSLQDKLRIKQGFQQQEQQLTTMVYIDPDDIDMCTVCQGVLVLDGSMPYCPDCKTLTMRVMDYSPEWSNYGPDDNKHGAADPARCGKPINPLLPESSIACRVMCDRGASFEMRKLQKWVNWQLPHKEKVLSAEFQHIVTMSQNAGIPRSLIDDALRIHTNISEQKQFRGLTRDGINAASLYISCRLNNVPRTAHEIAEIFKIEDKVAIRGCTIAVNIYHNRERATDTKEPDLCKITPESFIARYCSLLGLNQEMTTLVKFIARRIETYSIIENNMPQAITSGIICFVSDKCRLGIKKKQITAITGISEVTISKCYTALLKTDVELIPPRVLAKYSREPRFRRSPEATHSGVSRADAPTTLLS
jgi:transcription initiation factor TFIIB